MSFITAKHGIINTAFVTCVLAIDQDSVEKARAEEWRREKIAREATRAAMKVDPENALTVEWERLEDTFDFQIFISGCPKTVIRTLTLTQLEELRTALNEKHNEVFVEAMADLGSSVYQACSRRG